MIKIPLLNWIAKKLFGKKIVKEPDNALKYYDISQENISAIVSTSLSSLAFGDCSLSVDANGKNTKRSEYLNEIGQREFSKAKQKTAVALGTGMIASIPYSIDNGLGRKIYIDTIAKDRFLITGVQGDDITQIAAISDIVKIEKDTYIRWTDYSVHNGAYLIRNKATNESGDEVELGTVKQWANIPPEIAIGGVDRLPVAFFRCPAGGRRAESVTGRPITYGCDATISKIAKTFDDIEREFDKKKAKILASRALVKSSFDELSGEYTNSFDDDLFIKLSDVDNADNITIFDPAFRESAYYFKLEKHFAMLEKEIACSRGILTDLSTNAATATEIRRAMYATFCLTDDMRKEYTEYFNRLMYAVNVLCNYYSITPVSDYTISYDWGYSLLEDSSETFRQLIEGKSHGVISKTELRQFFKPDETPEEAKKIIDEIRDNEPTLNDIMGDD